MHTASSLCLSGMTELSAKPGHPTTLSHEEEEMLVEFACN